MRRPISSATHGLLDYPMGLLLIASPWLFGFGFLADERLALIASAIPVILGIMIIGQSLITDYELSLLNLLPLKLHLGLDVVGGIFLAASPFLFGFNRPELLAQASDVGTWVFHVVAGLGLLASGLLTRTQRSAPRGETLRTLDPTYDKVVEEDTARSGRFQSSAGEFPDAQQPGPDAVDVARTAPEASRHRGSSTDQ